MKPLPSVTIEREREVLNSNKAIVVRLVPDDLYMLYAKARRDAADETGLPLSTFPKACPYTAEQLRDRSFFPD